MEELNDLLNYESIFSIKFPDFSKENLQKNQDFQFFQTIMEILKKGGWFSIFDDFDDISKSIIPFYSETKDEYMDLLDETWTTFKIPWGIEMNTPVELIGKFNNQIITVADYTLQFLTFSRYNKYVPSNLQIYLSSGNVMCRIIKLYGSSYPDQLLTLVGVKGNPSSVKKMVHYFKNKEEYENVFIKFGDDFAKLMATIEL